MTSQDLVADALLERARKAPSRGWRRGLHRLTRGSVNPGASAGETGEAVLLDRIRQPIQGDYRIAFLSLKGGIGKMTTTIGLGSTFASLRGDCVIAVDANPDFGTLSQCVLLQTHSTVRDPIAAQSTIRRYSDVRGPHVVGAEPSRGARERTGPGDLRRRLPAGDRHCRCTTTSSSPTAAPASCIRR
nr:hypothetical protein JVH1_8229 [Rhodococcus sp. JVH1]